MSGGLPDQYLFLDLHSSDSLRHALTVMATAFEAAGLNSASLDARFLLHGILNCDAAALMRDPLQPIGENALALTAAARRRLRHEPVARILGRREFYGRPFLVTPDVLDPRADTECVVDLALEIVRAEFAPEGPVTIADIGVGSGAIIVTMLAELPNARGVATDVSAKALAVARENAAELGVMDRLTLIETRGLCGVKDQFNVIVSNPPYIATAEMAVLPFDVRDYDPQVALNGGPDGLAVYREIAKEISSFATSYWIVLEVSAGQAAAVEQIFAEVGAIARHRRKDLGGHVRAVALQIHR